MLVRQYISTGLIGLAALLFTGTFIWLICSLGWVLSSVRASGRVVQSVQRHLQDGDVVYCPVFAFQDAAGLDHTIHSSAGSNPPRFPVGSGVSVLYQTRDPANAHIEDWFILWKAPLMLMAFAGFHGAVGYVIGRIPPKPCREQSA
jgi:hypothetical protein